MPRTPFFVLSKPAAPAPGPHDPQNIETASKPPTPRPEKSSEQTGSSEPAPPPAWRGRIPPSPAAAHRLPGSPPGRDSGCTPKIGSAADAPPTCHELAFY